MDGPKTVLREKIRGVLEAIGAAERFARSARAVEQLLRLPEFQHARVVMAYDSFGFEVCTHAVLAHCFQSGKVLVLPRTRRRDVSLLPHRVADLDHDAELCRLGFREPKPGTPQVPVSEIDLIVVPGVAFDAHGNRLGRGRGYYDRFLAQPERRAVTCALAFECQMAESVPTGPHDHPLDVLVTEERVIRARLDHGLNPGAIVPN